MNLTRQLFDFIITSLRDKAGEFEVDTEENDTLHDAADALDDAVDMLAELGEI